MHTAMPIIDQAAVCNLQMFLGMKSQGYGSVCVQITLGKHAKALQCECRDCFKGLVYVSTRFFDVWFFQKYLPL